VSAPKVSVVMGVRDGARDLDRTLDSVLTQVGVALELVVVDDGSTDATRDVVLARARDDERVRLVEQPAAGLTAALVRGCAAARGEYVARQDCGDRSLPGRLATLAAVLDGDPRVVLAWGGTRFLAPRGELLYEIRQTTVEAAAGLAANEAAALRGPTIHGCVMFRRLTYEAVGGYREAFRVAQDLDLWLRMVEHGEVVALPEILYEARFSLGSISALEREAQLAAAEVALDAAKRRRSGRSDADELARARVATRRPAVTRRSRARAAYFVGSCLARRDRRAARAYLREAIAADPLLLRAWLRWVITWR
jgi:glycosyltransferase involved in cell wall biosynthesis